jgi:hypothetical protein
MIRASLCKNNLGKKKKRIHWILAVAILMMVGALSFSVSAGVGHNYTYVKSNLISRLFPADNITNQTSVNISSNASLRSFPYPYRAGLAICSDCDGCTRNKFIEVHKFLNTKENTTIGPGVGLEIADTFFPYTTIKGEMAYFLPNSTNKSADADLIEKYYHSGYIDSMHSFGDFEKGKFNRSLAIKILAALKKADMAPLVYINHGSRKNTQNIGHCFPWCGYCEGDNPHASQYHTDISIYQNDSHKGGPFRFLWKSDITANVGYNPLQVVTLADGRMINAFVRYSTTKKGAIKWHLDNLQDQISDENLAKLISSGKYMIIANHLCYIPPGFDNSSIFNDRDVAALRNLAKKYEDGLIYVAPTSKLLMYSLVHDNLKWNWRGNESIININIQNVSDPASGNFTPSEEQLQGITFYTPNPEITHVYVTGTEIKDLEKNPSDYKGRKSVTIPIRHLPPLPEIEHNSELHPLSDPVALMAHFFHLL